MVCKNDVIDNRSFTANAIDDLHLFHTKTQKLHKIF